MWLSGQFQDSLFFLRKDFECTKNAKSNNFHLLRSFCARKIVAFAVFCWFIFVFIGWFRLNLRFCALKNFFVKKNRLAWNCSNNLIYYNTDVYPPINLIIENLFVHIYFYLWSSVRIFSFYENLSYLSFFKSLWK